MTVNLKLKQGAEAYQDKIRLGLVVKTRPIDPIEKARQNPKSLRTAINAKCYDCCCYQKVEVKYCTAVGCPLHHLRPWQSK